MDKQPEAIILIGIQASGKSTFYKNRFFNSHVRISNDLLRTKHRVARLLAYCFETGMSFVVDNTNVERSTRAVCVEQAKARGYRVIAYYFEPDVERSTVWNSGRVGKENIPLKGILGTYKRLEAPLQSEGFDDLPNWQKRGVGLYWVDGERAGYNPKERVEVLTVRKAIKVDMELPMRDEYSDFILNFLPKNGAIA